ncbi:hypothetical protein [Streptomyces griseosporeus]|uniref:hypothetical protein n=1 Tax=Streptomyces griseosporeus TaxID=1910 RepID=UPI003702C289
MANKNEELDNRFIQYLNAVEVSDLSLEAKMMAVIIAKHYNWTLERDAYPTDAFIAVKMKRSIRSVGNYKRELEEGGWLQSTQRYNTSSLYRPLIPAGFSWEAAHAAKKAKADALQRIELDRKAASLAKKQAQQAELEAKAAAYEALMAQQQEPVSEAQEAPEDTEVKQPETEPQKPVQRPEMTDADAKRWTDYDEWSDDPEPASETAKPTATGIVHLDIASKCDTEVKGFIEGSDNPDKARSYFLDTEGFHPEVTNEVERARKAHIEVIGDKPHVVKAQASNYDHDDEW